MQRGRAYRQHDNSLARDPDEPLAEDKEPRVRNRKRPEKLLWKCSQNGGKNSLAFANSVPEEKTKIVVRKWNSNVLSKAPRLDPGVTDNFFTFLSMLQQVPSGLGTKGFEEKHDVQGCGCALSPSLQGKCEEKLHQGDNAESRELESGLGLQSCRISRGVSSHPLESQSRIQATGNPSKGLQFAGNRVDASAVAPRGPRFFSRWRRGGVQQQQQPGGLWCRTLLSSLAGAAGLKMLSPKLHWLLPDLVTLPWLRNPKDNEGTERTPILQGRRWWHLPVKVAMAISSRFCGSLSNSFVAAHLLLLILELRGRRQQPERAVSDLIMLKDLTQGGRCRSCSVYSDQNACDLSFSKGDAIFLAGQRQERSCPQTKNYFRGTRCGPRCVNACKEATQAQDDDLPWEWREEIAQLIALTQKAGANEQKTAALSKEDIVHLTDLIRAVLSTPRLRRKPSTEHLAPASSKTESLSEGEGRGHLGEEAVDRLDACHRRGSSDGTRSCDEFCGTRSHLRQSKSEGSLRCVSSSRRRAFVPSAASASSLQHLELVTVQNITGESPRGMIQYLSREDARCEVNGASVGSNDAASQRVNCCIPSGPEVTTSFVSEDFLEGIENVFPPHAANEQDCLLEADDYHQSARMVSKAHPVASENSALLRSILLEKCRTSLNSSKSSVYASDVEDSEYFFEACSLSLPDLERSEEQRVCELEALHLSTSSLEHPQDEKVRMNDLHASTSKDGDHNRADNPNSWFENGTNVSSRKPDNCDPHFAYNERPPCEDSARHIPNVESSESLKSLYSEAPSTLEEEQKLSQETASSLSNSSNFELLINPAVEKHREDISVEALTKADTAFQEHPGRHETPDLEVDEEICSLSESTSAPVHFANHPTCTSLRERRHEHGDQNYLSPDELNAAPWSELVFWHGHCQQGNPTLCVLLGKAVQKLPAGELHTISSVIISQMEYAELNFFKGSAKQMNIIMDLWGLGLMRMPPLDILSRIGMIMNRDYAGRGGSVFLVNAPVMLSLVMGAIKRVILCPAYNKGAMIEKGFLERKDRIFLLNRNYKHALEKRFESTLLPSVFGGQCPCKSSPKNCKVGVDFLACL